jgi:hypothetical protein
MVKVGLHQTSVLHLFRLGKMQWSLSMFRDNRCANSSEHMLSIHCSCQASLLRALTLFMSSDSQCGDNIISSWQCKNWDLLDEAVGLPTCN